MDEQLDWLGRPRSKYQTVNNEPSLTVQSDADEADIQKILKKYKQVGIVDHLRDTELQYADVSEFTDYADLMRNVKEAEGKFKEQPAVVRKAFDNDVGKWLDAAHDGLNERQKDALVKAGVIEAPPIVNEGGDLGGVGETPPEGETQEGSE